MKNTLVNKTLLYSLKSVFKIPVISRQYRDFMNYIMIKLTYSIFISFNNFFVMLFTHIKMSKDPPGKYYPNNKERLKNAREIYQSS